jgi:hypothetical protein
MPQLVLLMVIVRHHPRQERCLDQAKNQRILQKRLFLLPCSLPRPLQEGCMIQSYLCVAHHLLSFFLQCLADILQDLSF